MMPPKPLGWIMRHIIRGFMKIARLPGGAGYHTAGFFPNQSNDDQDRGTLTMPHHVVLTVEMFA